MTKIAEDPDIPLLELPKRLFDVYKDARLRALSAKQKESANRALSDVRHEAEHGTVTGGFRPATNQIILYGLNPQELRYYQTLAHEMEHAIQHATEGRVKDFLKGMTIRAFIPSIYYKAHYVSEFGAVKAEYDFLRSLPESAQAPLLKAIAENYQHYENRNIAKSLSAIRQGDFRQYQRQSAYPDMAKIRRSYPFNRSYPLIVSGLIVTGAVAESMPESERKKLGEARLQLIEYAIKIMGGEQ